MGYDQDPPTRRMSPQDPARGDVVETETTHAPDDLRDRLRSLQTALALVGVLAVAALGLALWTLLADDDGGGDARGASPQRVDRLQDRVSTLEDRVENRATNGDVSDVRDDLESLQSDVEEAQGQSDGPAQEDVDALEGDIEELRQQVADLAQQDTGGEQEQP